MVLPVKWFSNAMEPTMLLSTGSAGSAHTVTPGGLISLLKACLVTGFGIKTVSAINYDAANAKIVVTIPSGHTYQQYQVIELSGANESGFNGEFRVMKVTTTTVECALDNGVPSATSATGSLSAKIPGLGWAIAFEDAGTYRCIFKRTDAAATEYMLYVDNSAWSGWNNSNGHLAKVQAVTAVTDISTFTVVKDVRWPCSHNYGTPDWLIAGDGRCFYFLPRFAVLNLREAVGFGDFPSLRAGDKHNCLLIGHWSSTTESISWSSSYSPYNGFAQLQAAYDMFIMRSQHQQPGVVSGIRSADHIGGYIGAGLPISASPINMANSGFYWADKVKVFDDQSWRGYMPGLRAPYSSPSFDKAVMAGIDGSLTLGASVCRQSSSSASLASALIGFDLVGPWR